MAKKVLYIRVEERTLQQIEKAARQSRREKSEVARLLIEKALHDGARVSLWQEA